MDYFSKYIQVVRIKEKRHTANVVEEYKKLSPAGKYFKNGVESVHTDGGGEYKTIEVNLHIERTPDTPQHNPFAEHLHRELVELFRVMLEEVGLGAKYWEYAI